MAMMRGARRALGLAAHLLVAVAIFVIVGEALARALDIVDRMNGYGRFLYTRGPSAELPYLLRPGLEVTLFGIPVRVNRLGFRGPERAASAEHGARRVVMLGDSVLFGTGLREEDRMSEALERRLNEAERTRWEVVNAGVPGYDTVAEARLLEHSGVALGPSDVVVVVSLNDYQTPPRMSPVGVLTRGDPQAEGSGLLAHSELFLLFRWLVAFQRGTLWHHFAAQAERAMDADPQGVERASMALDRAVQQRHLGYYARPDPPSWSRLRGELRSRRDLAALHDIRLLFVIAPAGYQVGVPEPDLTPQRALLATCAAEALSCLDLHPAFAAADPPLFQDTQHPNARGHAIAAAEIARRLLVDVDGPPKDAARDPVQPRR